MFEARFAFSTENYSRTNGWKTDPRKTKTDDVRRSTGLTAEGKEDGLLCVTKERGTED